MTQLGNSFNPSFPTTTQPATQPQSQTTSRPSSYAAATTTTHAHPPSQQQLSQQQQALYRQRLINAQAQRMMKSPYTPQSHTTATTTAPQTIPSPNRGVNVNSINALNPQQRQQYILRQHQQQLAQAQQQQRIAAARAAQLAQVQAKTQATNPFNTVATTTATATKTATQTPQYVPNPYGSANGPNRLPLGQIQNPINTKPPQPQQPLPQQAQPQPQPQQTQQPQQQQQQQLGGNPNVSNAYLPNQNVNPMNNPYSAQKQTSTQPYLPNAQQLNLTQPAQQLNMKMNGNNGVIPAQKGLTQPLTQPQPQTQTQTQPQVQAQQQAQPQTQTQVAPPQPPQPAQQPQPQVQVQAQAQVQQPQVQAQVQQQNVNMTQNNGNAAMTGTDPGMDTMNQSSKYTDNIYNNTNNNYTNNNYMGMKSKYPVLPHRKYLNVTATQYNDPTRRIKVVSFNVMPKGADFKSYVF